MAPHPRIGTRIRRAMERKRMRQSDLAKALGVSRSAVNAWINDRAYPQASIGALEEVLGISLDSADEEQLRPISPELRKLVAETLEDEEVRRQVIGLLEGTLSLPSEDEREAHRRAAG